uniref:CRISPR-associated endonuclease Cas1 n=1 Tax=uncultured bacterium UPO47 TaxID=1776972 RepID=A0A126SY82_9BACT|nr:CRISPR-associated protein Cas1 [uncultured bacterium UPO47]
MAEHRVLMVESPARLSIDLGRLRIETERRQDHYVLPRDIAVLCLHHHTITLSVAVLKALAAGGAMLIVTDDRHMPLAMHYPLATESAARRLRQQWALDGTSRAAALWQQIVRARLRTQAANLRTLQLKGALRLQRLVTQVQPGDAGHHEGQAARHYWKHLFPAGFVRRKQGADDPLNAALNYGYAVLRALVARELAAAGLHPALGVGHRNLENPFCLADDLMEPYRYLVELRVRRMASEMHDFGRGARTAVARLVEDEVPLPPHTFRAPVAVRETVASYCRALAEPHHAALALPDFG